MATYLTGQTTKNKILECSKNLFYEKGYTDTSFTEICKQADVNPGSIIYHFNGGKSGIAKYLYNSLLQQHQQNAKSFFPNESEITLMIISLCLHQYLLFNDAHYRKFSSEFTASCINEFSIEEYEDTIPIVYEFIARKMDPLRAKFYFSAIAGMDSRIEPFIDKHIHELTFTQSIHYVCEIYLWFVDTKEREEMIDYALERFQELSITNSEFEISVSKRHLNQ